ncbi:MAG: hypothetical protein DMD96_08750 [Candidatus Rokuibacteriota bacterium]|nr:MAG: hypothetical protein DMD96_08750 [Candidatus Rokubacteria bacterium]
MDDQKKVHELFGQLTGKAVETMTMWADANQRVLRELVEFSAATAKEGVRLYAELQQGALETLRNSQAAAGRWQGAWSDGAKDPVQVYQKAVMNSVDSVEAAFKLLEGQAQAITRSAERLQTSAEQAGKGIQQTYTAVVEKMKDVYCHN